MARKILLTLAYEGDRHSPKKFSHNIHFARTTIKELTTGHRRFWFFHSDFRHAFIRDKMLIICRDGILKVGTCDLDRGLYYFRKGAAIPPQCIDDKLEENYAAWLQEHKDWQPPHTIYLSNKLQLYNGKGCGYDNLYLTSATDNELERSNLQFIFNDDKGQGITLRPPDYILTQKGTVWKMYANGKLTREEHTCLVTFPKRFQAKSSSSKKR